MKKPIKTMKVYIYVEEETIPDRVLEIPLTQCRVTTMPDTKNIKAHL